MDPTNDVQTELLRNIWKQMVAMDRNLSDKIDQTNARLDTLTDRVDVLTSRVDVLTDRVDRMGERMEENFARVQRNFEKVDTRLEVMDARLEAIEAGQHERGRVDELDSRLTRVERHVGLRDRE